MDQRTKNGERTTETGECGWWAGVANNVIVLQLPCQDRRESALGGLCGAVVKGQTKGQMIVAAVGCCGHPQEEEEVHLKIKSGALRL